MDGMDALSVKSATAFAKKYVLENGPLMLEMVGHVLIAHLPCSDLGYVPAWQPLMSLL